MQVATRSTCVGKKEWWHALGPFVIASGALLLIAAPAEAQRDTTCATASAAYKAAQEGHVSVLTREAARKTLIECANQADETVRLRGVSAISRESSRLAKVLMAIPEFHDEGRLYAGRDASGPFLGPMAHIYASPNLATFTRRSQIAEQGTPGMLAALVLVELGENETIPGTYRRLHLREGLNCIWLHLPDALPNTRYWAFVSQATQQGECDRTASVSPRLEVQSVQDPHHRDHDDYPPAARFDTDVSLLQPVIAFKCLDAFCEVGLSSGSVRRPTGVPANTQGLRRQKVIKGWHDEQWLAVRGTDNVWRPSDVGATITPEPGIDALAASDFRGTWRKVATLTIHTPFQERKYRMWGLQPGENEVWIQDNAGRWEAEIRTVVAGRPVRRLWKNVHRMIHYDAAVPPTARFRWTVADDGIWVPCGNACCRADGT